MRLPLPSHVKHSAEYSSVYPPYFLSVTQRESLRKENTRRCSLPRFNLVIKQIWIGTTTDFDISTEAPASDLNESTPEEQTGLEKKII